MAPPAPFRLLRHSADLRLSVGAPDFPALCALSALALSTLVTDRRLVRPREERLLPVPPGDPDEALHSFLRSVLLLLSADRFLVRSAAPVLPRGGQGTEGFRISLRGEPADPLRHRFPREVKGVTRHAFEVEGGGSVPFRARFVVDV